MLTHDPFYLFRNGLDLLLLGTLNYGINIFFNLLCNIFFLKFDRRRNYKTFKIWNEIIRYKTFFSFFTKWKYPVVTTNKIYFGFPCHCFSKELVLFALKLLFQWCTDSLLTIKYEWTNRLLHTDIYFLLPV